LSWKSRFHFVKGNLLRFLSNLFTRSSNRVPLRQILKVLRDLPNIQTEDVDELEQLIKRGSLPIRLEGEFGGEEAGDER
jgi:hypothetical protein